MEQTGLIKFDTARQALAEAATVDEAKAIRDKAEAARVYAKQIGCSLEMQNRCAEIKIRAERRAGEILRQMKERGERKGGHGGDRRSSSTMELDDMGIEKKQSHRWQRVAEVPEQKFEEHIEETKSSGDELTTASILRVAQQERKRAKIEDLKEVEDRPVQEFGDLYQVVVIDPPWPMKKIDRECRPNQVEFDYPTMKIDEIILQKPPMFDDCHVWLWTTQKFLPKAFAVFEAWDIRYVCTFVWHKTGGFQPVGLPQYNCEFVLYGRVGKPLFVDTKQFFTCFEAPRTAHSEKPEEFYKTICRVTSGHRLDMYGRRPIDGFQSWGKES